MGDERGQPETGIWTRAADPHPVRPGEYQPRRAKPGPPDPYLPRSEHPLRSGPYLRSGASSVGERLAPRPDPLRAPLPAPDPEPTPEAEPAPEPAPTWGQAAPPVPDGAFGWWNTNGNFVPDQDPDGSGSPGPDQRGPRRTEAPVQGQSVWDRPAAPEPAAPEPAAPESTVRDRPAGEQPAVERSAMREQSATREQIAQERSVWERPATRPPTVRDGPAGEQPAVERSATREQIAQERSVWERPSTRPPAVRERPARERPGREQAAPGQSGPGQPAPWHTGKRDIEDEPVPVQPREAAGPGPRRDADRYPADFPTQVFMSSALAAWEQPAQAAPDGNWPQIPAAPAPPGRYESAEPSGRAQPASPDERRAPAPSRAAGPRHATAAGAPGVHPGWDRELAAAAEPYPATGAHRSAARRQDAPFPRAQDPAGRYPAPPSQPWSPAETAYRSGPSAKRREVRTALLVGAACLAALIAVALILFAVLPG